MTDRRRNAFILALVTNVSFFFISLFDTYVQNPSVRAVIRHVSVDGQYVRLNHVRGSERGRGRR